MKPLYLEFVNTGVANRFDMGSHELIEMNWRLKMYPELFNEVLMHELDHDDGSFKSKDLVHDMKSRTPGLFKFMRNHISAWTQILPIYWDRKRGQMVYDWSAMVSWILLFSSIYIVYAMMGWINYIVRNGIW